MSGFHKPPPLKDLMQFMDGPKGCKIDMEKRSGDYPPFILDSFGNIKYPVGSKILTFGEFMYIIFVT